MSREICCCKKVSKDEKSKKTWRELLSEYLSDNEEIKIKQTNPKIYTVKDIKKIIEEYNASFSIE